MEPDVLDTSSLDMVNMRAFSNPVVNIGEKELERKKNNQCCFLFQRVVEEKMLRS